MSADQSSASDQDAIVRKVDPEDTARQLGEILSQFDQDRGPRHRKAALPTFLVIGASGTGKSTALRAAGLRSPAKPPQAKAGTGPPLLECWFAGGTAYVVTAGRLTTQETPLDRQNWSALLSALGQAQSSHPLAGVIIAASLAMIAEASDTELEEEARAIRQRLREVEEQFAGARFHVVFTKADLIAGFEPFMGGLSESERKRLWAAVLPPSAPGRGRAETAAESFDEVLGHLRRLMPERLHELCGKNEQLAAFQFPQEFARLKPRIVRFLQLVAGEPGVANRLRSINFTAVVPPLQTTPSPTAYFLHDLLATHLPAEAPARPAATGTGRTIRVATMAVTVLALIGIVGLIAECFFANRSMIAAVDEVLQRNTEVLSQSLGESEIEKVDFENVVDALAVLASLSTGRGEGDRLSIERLPFGQSMMVEAAAEQAYRKALERQFLPRLVLQAEQAVRANFTEPSRLHDPLKAYLQLGGRAPDLDGEFVTAWFVRDWELNRYPGPANQSGRRELEAHLRAMLDLGLPDDTAPPLDQSLVEAAQRSLASMPLADLAWARILSASHSVGLDDHRLASRLGPNSSDVFETRDGRRVGTLRIPGFYTRAGFQRVLLPTLAELAEDLVENQWLLGAGGERVGTERIIGQIGPLLLDRYSREFIAVWNRMLDDLRLKPLADDPPDYRVLQELGASNSPLRLLIEWVAEETAFWRSSTHDQVGAGALQSDSEMAEGLLRTGIALSLGKSPGRAVPASTGTMPGSSIEAHFRPFHALVDEGAGRRPIDALIQNFEAIHRSLAVAAGAPAQAEFARSNLQLQLHNLRINASRLPRQIGRIVLAAADELEIDRSEAKPDELEAMLSSIAGSCRELVDGTFPFVPESDRDAQLAAFTSLFAPGGELDRFFATNLAPLVDTGQEVWSWKQDATTGRELSQATLATFQNAAKIRQVFFGHGGSSPSLEIRLTPMSLHGDSDSAVLAADGREFHAYQAGNIAVGVTWPPQAPAADTALRFLPELSGRDNEISFTGPWGLLRLFQSAQFTLADNTVQARFLVGGRDVIYAIDTEAEDPFALRALAEFRCPDGL
jgi:type VI secretion system protein ImpL